jgi:hypothetical protein
MKFLVEVSAPADKGREIDDAGGPGPIVAQLMKRFTPEVMYGSADRRTLTFVADLASEHEIAVLMEICSAQLYAYPHLRPVISIDQMPEFVSAVHAEVGIH